MSFARDDDDPRFVAGLVLVTAVAGLAFVLAPRVSVTTYSRFANAPATIPVYIRITPEKDDRWLDIVADGPEWHLTGKALLGERDKHIHELRFTGLGPGCYVFSAYVRAVDMDGPILAQGHSWPVSIRGIGMDGDPCG